MSRWGAGLAVGGACDGQGAGLTFVVDLAVTVNVCFSDHLVHFLVGQLLSQVCHHVTQLSGADVSVAILTFSR